MPSVAEAGCTSHVNRFLKSHSTKQQQQQQALPTPPQHYAARAGRAGRWVGSAFMSLKDRRCGENPGVGGKVLAAPCVGAESLSDLPPHPLSVVGGGTHSSGLLIVIRLFLDWVFHLDLVTWRGSWERIG